MEKIQLSDHFTYKRLIRFVIPSIIMMIFTSIYSVVDGLFISNFVGKIPFAAVNLIMPFIMILGGFGFMFGTGGSALIAVTLGEGKKEKANQYFTMIVVATIILGIIFSLLGIIFIKPIALMLGATEEMLSSCITYGRTLLIFITAFMLQNIFQSLLIVAEKPNIGLIATVTAGITNMVLDAVFIIGFKWGVVGAALATGIGCLVATIIPVVYFIKSKDSILRFVKTKMELAPIMKAAANGSSEFVGNISVSIVSVLFNIKLMEIAGENGVAAYGVLMYVQFIFIAIFIGYSIGTAPIIGFNYGANNQKELQNMFKKSVVLMLSSGILLTILANVLSGTLAQIFVGYDAALYEMTKDAFTIFSLSFILAGFNFFTSSLFTALNNGLVSAMISFLRTLVFQIVCVMVLPTFLDLNGIWLAVVVAEVLATFVSIIFIAKNRSKYHYI